MARAREFFTSRFGLDFTPLQRRVAAAEFETFFLPATRGFDKASVRFNFRHKTRADRFQPKQ